MLEQLKRRISQFEAFAVDLVYDRRQGGVAVLFSKLLKGLSFIFSGIVQLRYYLYEKRFFESRSLGCLVVIVGNLTVGGTGKTPVVEKFARSLTKKGRSVAILSRGYKSKAEPGWRRFWRWITHGESRPPKVVSDGNQIFLDSEVAGDEPFMLAKNLPGVVVIVDKDRVKAGKYAIEKFGVDTLILDDGFQYFRLKGRLNLLLIDKMNPFGNGYLLPRGILREPIKHLKRASYIFLTKSNGQKDQELEETIKNHHPDVEIIECKHEPQYLQLVGGDGKVPLEALKNSRLAIFSGIASPEGFENYFKKLGSKVVCTERFLDHHRFTSEELMDFHQRAEELGADMIITTEKDAVRIPAQFKALLPVYFLRLEIEIIEGHGDFEKAVSDICFPKNEIPATRMVI